MKTKADSSSRAPGKSWIDRMIDFLLGPATHPVYMAGAAAGFGGAVSHARPRRVTRSVKRHSSESESAFVSLAASGFSAYGVHED